MPKLTDAELATFLDEPGHLVRVATVDGDGMPRNVPLWFVHHDRMIVFTPRLHSVLLGNVRRDPRIGLTIDEEALPYRKVSVQGTAVVLHEPGEDDVWRDLYLRIAMRYVAEDGARAYVTGTDDQPRALLGVRLADAKVSTWRMPIEGEDGTGIWHRRYYLDGTKMADIADGAQPA
jgi:nitroimidazol reductase NimA-like FMN-containing flavoprotein (pyridoxamine 5'-phosphate oxidase superfamily)